MAEKRTTNTKIRSLEDLDAVKKSLEAREASEILKVEEKYKKDDTTETASDTNTTSAEETEKPEIEGAAEENVFAGGSVENTPLSNETKEDTDQDSNETKDSVQSVLDRIESRQRARDEQRKKEDQEILELKKKLDEIQRQKAGKTETADTVEQKDETQQTAPEEEAVEDETVRRFSDQYHLLEERLDAIPNWKVWKVTEVAKIKKEREKLIQEWKEYDQKVVSEKEAQKIREEIMLDREAKPFLYYAINKVTNPIFERFKNKETGMYDLRWIENEESSSQAYRVIQYIDKNENEGFWDFDTLGFVKVIENVNSIRDKDGIADSSPKARFRILGPDGTILADNIEGNTEAERIYRAAIEQHRIKLEEEFNNSK